MPLQRVSKIVIIINYHYRSKCSRLKNLFTDPPTETSQPKSGCTPLYVFRILDSVQARIFIDCPKFNDNTDCEEMKNATKTCIKDKRVSLLSKIFEYEEIKNY